MPKITKIIIVFILLTAGLSFVVHAQGFSQHRLSGSSIEVSKTSYPQNISLIKRKNNEDRVVDEIKIVDQYLISNIPESEFLDKFSYFRTTFQDLKISIEADKPIFTKERFYYPASFFDKTKSFLGFESLPEYRIIKEVKDVSEDTLETDLKISDLEFKTFYNKVDGLKVKQDLYFKNNSSQKINFEVSMTHSLKVSEVDFGGENYVISEIPQFLNPKAGSLISFAMERIGQIHSYDFSDLLSYDPKVWVFKKGDENFLLIKISISLLPGSSIIIDPAYTVETNVTLPATSYSFQRKTWWDGNRYWVGYWKDIANRIQFEYSTDGTSWTENASARITEDTNDFSIDCDSTDCFLVYTDYPDVRTVKAVEYPDTAFSWSISTIVLEGDVISSYYYPYINKDDDDYMWVVGSGEINLGSFVFKAVQSQNKNNITSWNSSSTLGSGSNSNIYGVIGPADKSGPIMIAVWINETAITSNVYSRDRWGIPGSVATGVIGLEHNMSIVDIGIEVHLSYIKQGEVVCYRTSSGSGWSAEIELYDGSGGGVGIQPNYTSITSNTNNNDLYVFWQIPSGIEGGTWYLRYKKGVSPYATSDWDETQTDWHTTTNFLHGLTTNYFDNSKVFGAWAQDEVIGYEVLWQKIDLSSNASPTVGTVILNEGSAINLTENSTTAVAATATVTDTNGYEDIETVTGKLFRSAVGSGCSANNNNCYSDSSCVTSSCSGNSCDSKCEYYVYFHADPTDKGTYIAQKWETYIEATDFEDASDRASTTQELSTLLALDIAPASTSYGSLSPGQDTDTTNQTVTTTCTGNAAINIWLSGDTLVSGSNSIGVDNQEWSTSAFTYGEGTDLTEATTTVELDMSKPTSAPSTSTDIVYWGMQIPSPQSAGTYTGTTTYTAMLNVSPAP